MDDSTIELANLRDIVEPPPVPWWPPAPGWWLLLALAVTALGFVGYGRLRSWRRRAYRRTALAQVQRATHASDIASILKRAAMVSFPRSEVASLTGQDWCVWLGSTCPQPPPPEVARTLALDVYQGDASPALEATRAFAVYWIRNHRFGETSAC